MPFNVSGNLVKITKFDVRFLLILQLVTWYHRIKITALVLLWIFFTYLLMSHDEKEIERRQMAILPFETKGTFLLLFSFYFVWLV